MKKKSFGQHFLHDAGVIRKIVTAVSPGEMSVVEAGPGAGALTDELVKIIDPSKLTLVEADRDLIPELENKFQNIKIIVGDAAQVDLDPKTDWVLVSNLPYNSAAAILQNALARKNPPTRLIVMVQKEQADRMRAKDGEKSVLSVFIQLYTTPKKLFDVGRGAFQPPPNVDSTVMELIYNGSKSEENEKILVLAKAGFASKRKQLHKNLSASGIADSTTVQDKLSEIGLKPTARAQELSISEWRQLKNLLVD